MGNFPFANSRFQMGVTAMGFAEDFGHYLFGKILNQIFTKFLLKKLAVF